MNKEFTQFVTDICESEPNLMECILKGYAICEAENDAALAAISQELTNAQNEKAKADDEYQKKMNDALQLMAKLGGDAANNDQNAQNQQQNQQQQQNASTNGNATQTQVST